jgi:hypothetical protein
MLGSAPQHKSPTSGPESDIRSQECSSRSERTPRIGMPRECPPASRSERAAAGIDSTKRRSAPRPSAIGPVRCHVRYCAWRAKVQCGGNADLAGLTQRHNHGRLIRSQDDDVPMKRFFFVCLFLCLTNYYCPNQILFPRRSPYSKLIRKIMPRFSISTASCR